MTRRVALLAAAISLLPACQFCDDVQQFLPAGELCTSADDACGGPLLDLGPVTSGGTCTATLYLHNGGNADLEVVGGTAQLLDADGDFALQNVPALVRLGAYESIVVGYTAGATVGQREGAGVELQTNDPDDDGFLRGSITAFVAAAPVGLAVSACDLVGSAGTSRQSPCELSDFGAVPTSNAAEPIEARPGALRTVFVVNNGNAPLNIQSVVLSGGDGNYGGITLRRGAQVLSTFPVAVPAGVDGECGAPSSADNVVAIDVKFAPTALGASVATLQILTDGAEGALLEVPLSGVGAGTGILTNPEVVRFGEVTVGEIVTQDVLVQNVGSNTAAVNTSCIDVEDDGTCDADCTGSDTETALGGTVRCEVKRSDGSHEGKGFVLEATDAQEGGDDERTLLVTWLPSAAAPSIPATAVVALKSNIQNNKVFKVGLVGGAAGVLVVDSGVVCQDSHCLQASGDPGDVSTWTGTLTLTLTNTGTAPLVIQSAAAEDGTPPTIVDDWTIGAPGTETIAPNASTTLTLTYANTANDFSGADGFDLIVDHDGVLGSALVSIIVVPPT
ncbi:MAG: hypothetical protein FJ137_17875 [Deltaproteobacteria bacterium]|nr:hypothetical protein [Deltaproteobacteria bacterium]